MVCFEVKSHLKTPGIILLSRPMEGNLTTRDNVYQHKHSSATSYLLHQAPGSGMSHSPDHMLIATN